MVITNSPVVISHIKVRVELDGFVEVPNSLVIIALVAVGISPATIGLRIFWVNLQCFIAILDGPVIIALIIVRDGTIIVGHGISGVER